MDRTGSFANQKKGSHPWEITWRAFVETPDVGFGLLILADFSARLLICHKPWRQFLHP